MKTLFLSWFASLVFGMAMVGTAVPQDVTAEKPISTEAGKTHTIRSQPMVVRVELEGVLESTEMHEVRLVPDEWSSWIVDRAVAHGTTIRKGQPLVWFDRRALDRKLADLAAERNLTQLARTQAEEELALLEKSVPLELAKIRRTATTADEDLRRFTKTEKPSAVRSAKFTLESAENALAYEKEELKQLERMYKADDLTDETEEIILRRARDTVKRAEFSLEKAKEKHQETLEVSLPRKEAETKESLAAAKLALASAEVDLPLKLSQATFALEKLKYDHEKAELALKSLKQDTEKLIVHSPADGVVYYGRYENGQWTGADAATKMLNPGGTVTPHVVLLTIVAPSKLQVRAEVPQQQLGSIHPRLQAKTIVVGFDDKPIYCHVKSVAKLPDAAGKFSCVLEPDKLRPNSKKAQLLAPEFQAGMKCKVEVVVQANQKALTIPRKAAHPAEQWSDVYVIYVVDAAGMTRKQWVELGHQQGDLVEIKYPSAAAGWPAARAENLPWRDQPTLKDGDQVLLDKPQDSN